ncbi:MAG: hypothetical protein ACREFN_03210 [Acetobacteraceae bacterium]
MFVCPDLSRLTDAEKDALILALIDRLTDQAHIIIIITGADSYRFRRTTAQRKAMKS